jgi:tetratricopeptide (TPR) repeat protein
MSKNVLYCALGIVVGFFVGFFVVNSITRPGAQATSARTQPGSAAGPLRPEQMNGQLPPGHPDVGGTGTSTGGADDAKTSAASTSAEAQAAMDKADRAPKDFNAQAEAGRVFYGLQDYDKAALYLGRALAIKSGDFDALVLAADNKYDAGDFAAAATFYERALAVKPDSPDVRTDYGNTFFQRKDYDRAISEYRKSVAIDPNHLNSWKNIAAAALQKGDKATAAEAVAKLSALAPQSPETEAYRQQLEKMP